MHLPNRPMGRDCCARTPADDLVGSEAEVERRARLARSRASRSTIVSRAALVWNLVETILALVLVLLPLTACSPRTAPSPGGTGQAASTDYPGVLHPPNELSPDFVVEQHVELAKDDRHGAFDGVLQKRGDELVIVGLGPMGTRAFVLRQEGVEARFEQTMGPALPFPPRNVLVDVHRAFFKRLPPGIERGELDGEDVTEVWKDGSLVERRYVRPAFRPGAVRVFYGEGCTRDRCEPKTVRIVNEWFGYEIRIDNRRYHSLQ